jgi:hypothetical protein
MPVKIKNVIRFLFYVIGGGLAVIFVMLFLVDQITGPGPVIRYYQGLPGREKAQKIALEIQKAYLSHLHKRKVASNTRFEDLLPYLPNVKEMKTGDVDPAIDIAEDYKNPNIKKSILPLSCVSKETKTLDHFEHGIPIYDTRTWQRKCAYFANGAVIVYDTAPIHGYGLRFLIDPDGQYTGTPNTFLYRLSESGSIDNEVEDELHRYFP